MVEVKKGMSCDWQRINQYMAMLFSRLVLELGFGLKAEDLKNYVHL